MKNVINLLFLLVLNSFSFSQNGGPWDHKVFRALSYDGTNFIRDADFLFSPGSVPAAIIDTNQNVFLYYVKMDSAGDAEKLMVSMSDDGEYFFNTQQANISGSSVIRKVDPCAVLLDDGRIRLYYIDFDVVPPQDVHSAISDDGINFIEEAGIRYSDPSGITDPDVFYAGSWNMYVSKGTQLQRTTSYDGLTFDPDTNFIWNGGAVSSTIQISCGLFKTYYCGNGIQTANSPNGASLVPENNTCFSPEPGELVCDPTVIRLITGEFVMYFKSVLINTVADHNLCSCEQPLQNYPNPFSEATYIIISNSTGSTNKNAEVKIYDHSGREVSPNYNINSNTLKIERGELCEGIYFYFITSYGKIIGKGTFEIIN